MAQSRSDSRWLFLAAITASIGSVDSAKYGSATPHSAASVAAWGDQPAPASAASSASNSRPLAAMAAPLADGVDTLLVRRRLLRNAATAPSSAAPSAATGAPCRASRPNSSTSAGLMW